MVNHTSKSVSHGVGVRVCAEDRTGYAYSDEVTVDRMRLAAEAARAIADQRGRRRAPCRSARRSRVMSSTSSTARRSRSGRGACEAAERDR